PPEDRRLLLAEEKAYVRDPSVGWQALTRPSGFKRDKAFRASYTRLGESLLGRGDALVQQELRLSPRV
ncbi:MAG TPA: hypothetical protein VLN26_13820, partial [Gaiellaceae bacterium]|nr:hypothetical protein [Gaiellaceae bacterium]